MMPTATNKISFQIWNTAFQSALFNSTGGGTICGEISFGAIAMMAPDALPRASENSTGHRDAPQSCGARCLCA